MKIQFRSILFALVLPVAACGGDRETPSIEISPPDYAVQPKSDAQPVTSTSPIVPDQPKVEVVEAPVPVPTGYADLIVAGQDLVSKGEFGDAKEMFDAAIKLDTKKAEPHIELARMYIEMKEKGLAVASAKKAVKLAPLSSQAWNTKGRAELAAHKYDEAIEAFTKAIELNDSNVYAWNNLGYTELLLKRYEDAAEHLTEATSRDGATGYMFNNLGTALEHLDRLDDARLAYEAGSKLGSKEATSSRKRLEGVESIAIATKTDEGEVHDEVRGEAPKTKEYELTDEGDVEDKVEDPKPVDGSAQVDNDEDDVVEPGDNATL